MVFQMLALGPHAVQKLSSAVFPEDPPSSRLRRSPGPVVDVADERGEAIPCSVPGTVEITCDRVLCCVPAGVAAAGGPRGGGAGGVVAPAGSRAGGGGADTGAAGGPCQPSLVRPVSTES